MLSTCKKSDVYYTCKIKEFPDYVEFLACEKGIFGGGGWEARNKSPPKKPDEKPDREGQPDAENLERAARRARTKIRDYAGCNRFGYFVTLTVNPDRANRYDEKEMIRKVTKWMDNQSRLHGTKMIIIPEHHKDGAIHFHGLAANVPLKHLFDSGTIKMPGKRPKKPRSGKQREQMLANGGKVSYNWDSWKLGFSTVFELYGQYDAAINYVCKYIGKEMGTAGKIGGRWYYQSGKLAQPVVRYENIDIQDIVEEGGNVFSVEAAHLMFAKLKKERNHNRMVLEGDIL